eukprot:CAMPEP_0194517418 /NCGR_PEP_ID=MMETSP0253-20130528/50582_1 /TAXON_ID=2966 /ORGANISM="Noctiluca scintillans" /LENGTH=113 /DNA_ID=CAMNT_0039361377 /DNA_START=383 /DNA_END=722 /DNA_ORIENTATION=+
MDDQSVWEFTLKMNSPATMGDLDDKHSNQQPQPGRCQWIAPVTCCTQGLVSQSAHSAANGNRVPPEIRGRASSSVLQPLPANVFPWLRLSLGVPHRISGVGKQVRPESRCNGG